MSATREHAVSCGFFIDDVFKKIAFITTVGYVSGLIAIFVLVNEEVPDAYMDEIFHVKQARSYCVGNFTSWDPKITTPPGLYLTTLLVLKPFSELYAFGETEPAKKCPIFMLRGMNLIFSIANGYLLYLLSLHLHRHTPKMTKLKLFLSSLSLSTFPPLFFFTFLYYTDCGSLFFVLLMYLCHKMERTWTAAGFGVISLTYRQTNIVWVFFLASYSALKIMQSAIEKSRKKTKIVTILIAATPQIVFTCLGYLIVGILFLTFVIYNKGIVLGDRTSHVPVLHFAQLLYFLGFMAIFAFAWMADVSNLKKFISFGFKNTAKILLIGLLITFIGKHFVYVHPYLLADNRHYTFYVWRRIIMRENSIVPYFYIPLCLYSGWCFLTMPYRKDSLWRFLFLLTVAVSIVPQRLLEFRYFIPAFIIWRLNIQPNSSISLLLEFVANAAVNALTLYLFLCRPFTWKQSSEMQRFIW